MSRERADISEKMAALSPALHTEGASTVLSVAVIPRAPKSEVAGLRNGLLLVKVTAAPEKGKANQAVLEILSAYLGVAASTLTVLRGESARHKDILLQNRP